MTNVKKEEKQLYKKKKLVLVYFCISCECSFLLRKYRF